MRSIKKILVIQLAAVFLINATTGAAVEPTPRQVIASYYCTLVLTTISANATVSYKPNGVADLRLGGLGKCYGSDNSPRFDHATTVLYIELRPDLMNPAMSDVGIERYHHTVDTCLKFAALSQSNPEKYQLSFSIFGTGIQFTQNGAIWTVNSRISTATGTSVYCGLQPNVLGVGE